MTKFIVVDEIDNTGEIWLNLEQVVAIHPASCTIHTTTIHGNGNGILRVTNKSIEKLKQNIDLGNSNECREMA